MSGDRERGARSERGARVERPARAEYAPRRIAPLGVRDVSGWRVKVTRVLAGGRSADDELVDAALGVAAGFLPAPAVTPAHDGVGVVLVHQGSRYDFVLVGYWTFETELRYQTWMRASSDSTRLERLAAGELATDVWDLAVLAFERDAWLEHVLRPGTSASAPEREREAELAAYLGATLDTTM